MEIIDGRKIASDIINQLKSEVSKLSFTPVFCDILIGSDPVSAQYVSLKARRARTVGIKFLRADFPNNISTEKLIEAINGLNQTKHICGLIVQLPLPAQLNRPAILDAIDPIIDVDCLGKQRNKAFYQGDMAILPPTAAAVMSILDSLKIDLAKKNILVVGQGELVGKPLSYLLTLRGLNIVTADVNTENTGALMQAADVIVSATGRPKLITAEKVKTGCVIIDAGTAEDGGVIVGDADIDTIRHKASVLSPVPGGVGPVTVAMLLNNVVKVAKQKAEELF